MVGTSSLKGTLMIRRQKWFRASSAQSILRVLDPSLETSFGGKRQNLIPTLLSPVLSCWKMLWNPIVSIKVGF